MERSVHQERELRELWQSTHLEVHAAERKALEIAREEVNRRLDEMNELREQITRERGEFMRRDMFDREHSTLRDGNDIRLKALENTKSNMEGRLWAIGAAISALVVGLELILRYAGK